ncbi:MAG TPA: metallophosphoesterase family protein [Ktedonobacterales bacterium]|nr:metallophosphoesterase family protein [Ktedonobacterales bacterium]
MSELVSGPPPIAVIADIHGNRWALVAVLREIDRRGIQTIINLGDHLTGPLDPTGTAELLMAREMVNILGNDDRDLFLAWDEMSQSQRYTHERLSPAQREWLRAMPEFAVVADDVFACHGDLLDAPYLLEQVDAGGGVSLRATPAISASVARVSQPVIVSGHSHVPRTVALPDGKLLVNPGSVGLPAYTMDTPVPYAMEAGSPHARYAILTRTSDGWRVEHVALPYPWDEAAAAARDNGRADWAAWLASGRAG